MAESTDTALCCGCLIVIGMQKAEWLDALCDCACRATPKRLYELIHRG